MGLVERFNESLAALSHVSKWKITKNAPELNKTSASLLPVAGLSEETLAEIRKVTALDAQLYDYAESLLNEQLRAMDEQ